MSEDYIEIRGARENNLKNVSLRIPKRKITIFTGVSGSGKSSIVFDTIATEAQCQLYETFSMFVRNFLPRYSQPEADLIENLGMAIVVDQKRLGGGASITLARSSTTDNQPPRPDSMSFYFSTSDIAVAPKELNEKGVKTSEIQDNLYGPGSGVKFFQLQDPDGNQLTFAQE